MPRGCDQCEALMINGVFCHETGCPNSKKTWRTNCGECGHAMKEGDETHYPECSGIR